ncbi:lactosylceramide 1,3-N-acetyl-beta-D-glucosaminyltransferase B-like [Aplysia californica]|uniref:Lactosylceramide 1,3-N-acetyl-beta-D-glucosaminyltransferase B-like n=1 Tax=Aplysia californica TaxID=6500 RepID=A0ABM0ZUG2_APLCA|nr:lactosylceramide 1,3-N-acetyl-beta-D-glucosaminyltransferase B-like [Aplysia californica]
MKKIKKTSVMFKLGRKKTLVVIIAGLTICVLVLFLVDIVMSTHCFGRLELRRLSVHMSPSNVLAGGSGRFDGDRNMKAGNEVVISSRNTGNNMNNDNPARFFYQEYQADEGDTYNTSHTKHNRTRESKPADRDSRVRRKSYHRRLGLKDNILANISLGDLKHVTESSGINRTKFMTWSEKLFLSQNQIKASFAMPNFTIVGRDICGKDTELLILMPAIPDHQFTRELIRQTWASTVYGMSWPGRTPDLKAKVAFVFGTQGLPVHKIKALKRESLTYQDVVAADFVDSYRNLTLKMMVGLHWVSKHCPRARYVLKCDLDTFVNLPLMARILPIISAKVPRFMIGHRHEKSLPPVLRSGKWAVSETDYPFEYFPPYLIGHSYVMSADIAPRIVSVAKSLPLIPAEDAHITGVIARILRVPRLHFDGFAHLNKICLPCNILYNEDVSMTKMSLSRLLLMWRDIVRNTCSPRELPLTGNDIPQPMRNKEGKEKSIDVANNSSKNASSGDLEKPQLHHLQQQKQHHQILTHSKEHKIQLPPAWH